MTAVTEPLLSCSELAAGYRRKQVLTGVDLEVRPGEVLAVLGHNGAGKTTLLRTLVGVLPARAGTVRSGAADSRVAATSGYLTLVPAERFVFAALTIAENLELACPRADHAHFAERLGRVEAQFPMLAERPRLRAGSLSGGQQRMLSLGMALMRAPRVLLLDEPSLGLAPAVQDRLFDTVRELCDDGLAVVLVEQNVTQALRIADRVLILHGGRVSHHGDAAAMRASDSAKWWTYF